MISGHKAAVERAIEMAKTKGVRRAMLLPVSAPFHCALMAPAADAMAEALEAVAAGARPLVPVVANVSAAKATDPAEIARLLVRQVTATVRWRECVQAMVGARRGQLRRTRRRQGAVRPGAAHRAGRRRRFGRHAGRDRGSS